MSHQSFFIFCMLISNCTNADTLCRGHLNRCQKHRGNIRRGHKALLKTKKRCVEGAKVLRQRHWVTYCAEGTRRLCVEGTGVLCRGPCGIVSRALCRSVEGTGVLCGGPVVLCGVMVRGEGEAFWRWCWGTLLRALRNSVEHTGILWHEHRGIVSRALWYCVEALRCYVEDTEALCQGHLGTASCRVAFCRRHLGIVLRAWCIVRKALGHCYDGAEVLSRALGHCVGGTGVFCHGHCGIVSKELGHCVEGTLTLSRGLCQGTVLGYCVEGIGALSRGHWCILWKAQC